MIMWRMLWNAIKLLIAAWLIYLFFQFAAWVAIWTITIVGIIVLVAMLTMPKKTKSPG